MRVLVATSNPHKREELSAILSGPPDAADTAGGLVPAAGRAASAPGTPGTPGTPSARPFEGSTGIILFGLDALDVVPPEPVEDGETFEANARIKALAYARATGCLALADDSGLEVDALDGAPGVHSAYYAGRDGTRSERDARNNARLLAELAQLGQRAKLGNLPLERRTARFVCAMCLADPDGTVVAETRGTFEGLILEGPRGREGFGYDPLFRLPDRDVTSAELAPAEKNARSHRGVAARKMLAVLRARAGSA